MLTYPQIESEIGIGGKLPEDHLLRLKVKAIRYQRREVKCSDAAEKTTSLEAAKKTPVARAEAPAANDILF